MDIVEQLRKDAEYHRMVSYIIWSRYGAEYLVNASMPDWEWVDADGNPDATINYKHYINALKAVDEIEQLQKENKLLQKELQKHLTYQDHRHGRIGTHDPICYEYGPRHYECALREIDGLRDALREIKKRNPFHNVLPPMDKQYYAQIITEMVGIANVALKDEIQCATDENQ